MQSKKRVGFIFGTRPEAIKLAPVIDKFKKDPLIETKIIVTAQHRGMLDQVLEIFNIVPDYDLNIMRENQSLTDVTCKCLSKLEKLILQENIQFGMVQGDTTTAMSTALAFFYQKLPIAHIEAGLRTDDRYSPYPEEINRRIISVAADMHFAPTALAKENLKREGINGGRIYVTGNTVVDTLHYILRKTKSHNNVYKRVVEAAKANEKIILVTIHRRESFGKPMEDICYAVKDLIEKHNNLLVVLPVHPNPNVESVVFRILGKLERILLIKPTDYPTFIHLMSLSHLVLTDSGGVQEEAPSLNKPVFVLREKTERPEGLTYGVAKLVGTSRENIFSQVGKTIADESFYKKMIKKKNPYGDGNASERIYKIFIRRVNS
jgi:UDP-N-acetylglucosamine 2-epimerase (non-hydrolysing)